MPCLPCELAADLRRMRDVRVRLRERLPARAWSCVPSASPPSLLIELPQTSDGLCVSAYQEEEERPQEMVDELAPTPVQEDLEKRGLIGGLVCGLGILCPSPRARARARLRRDEHSAVHVEDDRDEQSLAEGEADDLDLLLNVPEQEQPHEEEETAEQKEHMKNLQVTRAILAERARDKRERKRAAAEARAAKAAKLRYGSVALAPLPGACEAHETMCDAGPWAIAPTVCVDAQTDLENCGACSNDCTQIAGAVGVECVLGGCRICAFSLYVTCFSEVACG